VALVKRYSKKREAILEVIQGTDIHPSAEWVYQRLKPEYPDLSLGTVYRNLTAFRQEGIIGSVGVICGQERFDRMVAPHTHFFCRGCGRVEDLFEVDNGEAVAQQAAEKFGLYIEQTRLTFEGLCEDCLQSEKKKLS